MKIIKLIKEWLVANIDKALHMLVCYSLVLTGSALGHLWLGVVVGVLLAFAKETIDWHDYGKDIGFDKFKPLAVGDLIADGIGILVAVGVAIYGQTTFAC